jgi:hypothetical protein
MPISMTQRSPGMPAAAYDEIIAHLAEPLRSSEGFISHAAQVTADGVTVTEVWEPASTGKAGTPLSAPLTRSDVVAPR